MIKKIFWVGLFLGLFATSLFAQEGEKLFPAAEKPAGKIFLGEKMTFQIRYLGIAVGEAAVEVREIVPVQGRPAYHIVVTARSAPVLDWVYPVNDVHHSYIDTEKLHSLRYEKKISEGRYRADEVMEYDQEKHLGYYLSVKDGSRKEMWIPKDAQDQISCGFWFRLQDVKPDSQITIPVNADEKNWELNAVTRKIKSRKVEGVGTFQAIEVEPVIMFEGFFVRRGKVRGWMSMDERRIPLVMKVNIPVLGSVKAVLTKYEPGAAA